MKALIVYDSTYGNTEQVAQAMTTALAGQADVTMRRVADVTAEQLSGLGLLIVGSPTQGFQPTTAIKALLERIPAQGLQGVQVAAFDTRITTADMHSWLLTFLVKRFGYAARPIADRLQQKAGELVAPPEGFLVQGKEGPLRQGELVRAADWAKQVMATVLASAPVPA